MCNFITFLFLILITSCAHRGDEVNLKAEQNSVPTAYSTFSKDKPYLRKWAKFHAYRNATVVVSKLEYWDGERAISGNSIAINLNEGSALMNTTAHPQYFDIWFQIPSDISLNQPYALQRVATNRKITRTRKWGSDPNDSTDFSALRDGEITLSGMQGYDVPTLRGVRRPITTITVMDINSTRIKFRFQGKLPVKEEMGETRRYHVNIDRIYEAQFKPIK